MSKKAKKFIHDFILCGICGWCMEIIFTSLKSLQRRNLTLTGTTSLWMFPIYGSAVLLKPLFVLLKKKPLLMRGLSYAAVIFSGEYFSGLLLSQHSMCPWNYHKSRFHVNSLIRLDFTPLWFMAGLLFERILSPITGRNTERTG